MSTALKVSAVNNVKVYNCSAGKTVPQWIDESKKNTKSLRYNMEFRNRIELLQDFTFPEASQCVRISGDGQYIGVTGVYKPQLKVFDTEQLSQKFERHIDSEAVSFLFLEQDFRKMALLRADRYIELHQAYGLMHKTRLPKFGRDLKYHRFSCDLYAVGSSNEAWRLNLEEGRFMAPLQTEAKGNNCMDIAPIHSLLAFGGENGVVECWDPRDRTKMASLDIAKTIASSNHRLSAKFISQRTEVTALAFDPSGMQMGVGMSTGHTFLYDIRSSKPMLTKDHRYGTAIKKIIFHPESGNVVTADKQIIKIWNKRTGKAYTSIEPSADINDLAVFPDTGLILAAGEQHRIQSYYVPSMGPAPKWCSFLDSLTEEMEERNEQTLYDDYKFVTREELEDWGMSHLIGSNLLRVYMHGFFMDMRLYQRVKSAANPDAYEEYMKQKVKEKVEAKTSGRIIVKKNLPNVNKALAKAILSQPKHKRRIGEMSTADNEDGVKDLVSNPLRDDRFSAMFSDKAFEIDVESEQYARLNPQGSRKMRRGAEDDRFDAMDDADDGSNSDSDDSDSGSDEESDGEMVYKKQGGASGMALAALRGGMDEEDDEDDLSSGEEQAAAARRRNKKRHLGLAEGEDIVPTPQTLARQRREREKKQRRNTKGKMYELKQGYNMGSVLAGKKDQEGARKKKRLSLAERLAAEGTSDAGMAGLGGFKYKERRKREMHADAGDMLIGEGAEERERRPMGKFFDDKDDTSINEYGGRGGTMKGPRVGQRRSGGKGGRKGGKGGRRGGKGGRGGRGRSSGRGRR